MSVHICNVSEVFFTCEGTVNEKVAVEEVQPGIVTVMKADLFSRLTSCEKKLVRSLKDLAGMRRPEGRGVNRPCE